MSNRLLAVFTRLAAAKDDDAYNEFVAVWKQSRGVPWSVFDSMGDCRLVVLHGNKDDYPTSAAGAAAHAASQLDAALKDLPESHAGALGVLVHGNREICTLLEAALAPRPVDFVFAYSHGSVVFESLAQAVIAKEDYSAALAGVWTYFVEEQSMAKKYARLGDIRHAIIKAASAVVQDVQTLDRYRFTGPMFDEITREYAARPPFDVEQLRRHVYGSSESIKAVIDSDSELAMDPEIADALMVLEQRIPEDGPLPDPVGELLQVLSDPVTLVQWNAKAPGQAEAVETWWMAVEAAVDRLMKRVAAAAAPAAGVD